MRNWAVLGWNNIGVGLLALAFTGAARATQGAEALLLGEWAVPSESSRIQDITASGLTFSVAQVGQPLGPQLSGVEYFIIPEQSYASPAELQALGASWASDLQSWVAGGGVVIQLDGFDSRYMVEAAGLITLGAGADASNQAVSVMESSDPLATGVSETYTALLDSVSYSSSEGTVVVETSAGRAVVLNNSIGSGHVVVIGHDYSSSNAAMETILVNAVTRLPAGIGGLTITTTGALHADGYVGGPFNSNFTTLTIANPTGTTQSFAVTPDQVWVDVSPPAGSIVPGGSATITLSVSGAANALGAGDYVAAIAVENTTTPATRVLMAGVSVGGVGMVPFVDGFEAASLGPAWRVSGTGDAATGLTGLYSPPEGARHALLSNANSGVRSRNELTLTLDLLGAEGVELSFTARGFSLVPFSKANTREIEEFLTEHPELNKAWSDYERKSGGDKDFSRFLMTIKSGDQASTNPAVGGVDTDAVLISTDGVSWYEVQDLRTSLGLTNRGFSIDLDEAIGRHGLNYNDRFRIRFNQVARYGVPADGLVIDEVSVSAGSSDSLVVTPLSSQNLVEPEGGPFGSSATYVVVNEGSTTVNVAVSLAPSYLSVSPSSLSLPPGGSESVTVSIAPGASALAPGIHEAELLFENQSTLVTRQRTVRLGIDTRRVAVYTQFTDKGAGGELENSKAAIARLSTNFFWREAAFSNELVGLLPQSDVVLVADQDQGGSLFSLGQQLGSDLGPWVINGGVLVQCSEATTWQLLDGTGLLDIDNAADATGMAATVTNAADPLAAGVEPYTASAGSAFLYSPEIGTVISTATNFPMAINRRLGAGNVVAIGHDYSESTQDQDRVLANSIFGLPGGDALGISGGDLRAVGFAGGPFAPAGTLTITNNESDSVGWQSLVTSPWLRVEPAAGLLAPGESVAVVVGFETSAASLTAGEYSGQIIITNINAASDQLRSVQLQVRELAQLPFHDGFESIGVAPVWYRTGTGPYSIDQTALMFKSGGFSLGLSSEVDASFARCEATLAVDMRGREGAALTFWVRSLGDSKSAPSTNPFVDGGNFDGLAISGDEQTWHEVQEFRRTLVDDEFTSYTVNLGTAMADSGIASDSILYLRFNQFGNARLGAGGGVLIDDVSITQGTVGDLLVSPGPFVAEGPVGGPFLMTPSGLSIRNLGPDPTVWSVEQIPTWLEVAPLSGSLALGEAVSLTLGINSLNAPSVVDMQRLDFVMASTTSGVPRVRTIKLKVDPVNVLVYSEHSDRSVEIPRMIKAVEGIDGNFVVRYAESAASVIDSLAWADTLLLPEVTKLDDFGLSLEGIELASELSGFLNHGGRIVVCSADSGSGSPLQVLTGAGLLPEMTISRVTGGTSLEVVGFDSQLTQGLADYSASQQTATFLPSVGEAQVRSSSGPTASRIVAGNGDIVIIGHSFFSTTHPQSLLLTNSLMRRRTTPTRVDEWTHLD